MALHTNRPTEWSNQDLGWSIPIFDIPDGLAGMKRVLDRVVATGSKLLITDFDWPSFQTGNPNGKTAGNNDNGSLPGNNFGSAKHDQLMDECETRGIYVVAGCQYTPGWAKTAPGGDKVPPDRDKVHYADYANFVWNVVDRYQTRNPNVLIAVSIWNEPNISTFWQDPDNHNGPYVVNYSKMLIAAYDAVKTGVIHAAGGDRNRTAHAEVMVGNAGMSPSDPNGDGSNGSSYSWPRWTQGLIDNNATFKFDVFFVHPYMWQCPGTDLETWNPLKYIQPCYSKLKTAGRNDINAWATECGGGTRPNDSGTDPGSTDCATGGPAGGYNSGAPAGKYNTNRSCVDYDTAVASRVPKFIEEWRSLHFYDNAPAVNRQWSGPLFVWTLNDEAPDETTWTGANAEWQPHAGCYVHGTGDGTKGAAKPHAATWINSFTNTGGPGSDIPDTDPPETKITSINGVDVTQPAGPGVPIGFATGAGKQLETHMDAYKSMGCSFMRCALAWSAGSSGDNATFDNTDQFDDMVAYANSIGLDVILQVAIGTTYAGHLYDEDFGPSHKNVKALGAAFVVNVARHFNGVKRSETDRDDNYVRVIEVFNEPNHAKADRGLTGVGPREKGQNYAEILIRIFHEDFGDVTSYANVPEIIMGGLGGEKNDDDDVATDLFLIDCMGRGPNGAVSFAGHTFADGAWGYFQGFTQHPYHYYNLASNDTDNGWWQMRVIMKWFYDTFGVMPPIWITEIGWPTDQHDSGHAADRNKGLHPPGFVHTADSDAQDASDGLEDAYNLANSYIANGSPAPQLTPPWDLRCFARYSYQDDNKPPGDGIYHDNFHGVVLWNNNGPGGNPDPTLVADGGHAVKKPHLYDKFVELAAGGGGAIPVPVVSGSNVVVGIYANDDDSGVSRVDVILDGNIIGSTATGEVTLGAFGYAFVLDSTLFANGDHTLKSKATDVASNPKTSIGVKFTIQNAAAGVPNVTSVDPDSVPAASGGNLTIGGINLKVGATTPTVEVGTVAGGWVSCTVVSSSATSIVATAPAHAAGTVHTRVTTSGGTSGLGNADKFAYAGVQPPGAPVVTRIIPPALGALAGGNHITLEGNTFTGATGVFFYPPTGSRIAAAGFSITSDTAIDVTVPGPETAGIYDVRVENTTGVSAVVALDAYTYADTPAVDITGGVSGGDVLTGLVGPITIEATDSGDPDPVVVLMLDGSALSLTPTRVNGAGTPDDAGDFYQFFLDTTTLANVTHTLQGRATNDAGVAGFSALIAVTTDNVPINDTTAPTAVILSPSTGTEVSGQQAPFTIQSIDDRDPVTTVELWITSSSEDPPPPATGGFELGQSQLGGSDELGGAPPPADPGEAWVPEGWGEWGSDATVNPLQLVGFGVPDDTGQIFLVLWNTTTVANGIYQLQARAVDSSLNERWSIPISVTVANVDVIPPHPGAPDDRYLWRVYVRDGATLKRTAIVKGYHSLDVTIRLNDVGVFTLIVPTVDPAIPYLVAPLVDDALPPSGILVYYKDRIVFSGDVTEGHRTWDQDDSWEFVGEDDNAFLRNRLLHGSPEEAAPDSTPGPHQGRWAHSVDPPLNPDGTPNPMRAESLIWYYVNRNVGPGAVASRRAPSFAMSIDQQRGTDNMYMRPGFSDLLPNLQNIAAASTPKLGFRILQVDDDADPTHKLRFSIFVPVDKSAFVRFATQLGNLTSFTYDIVAPTANVIYGAGVGEGADREYVELIDSTSISRWRRRETLTDHADANNLAELALATLGDAVALAAPAAISLEPKDKDNARFVDDYNLGDKVTFVLPEGTVFADVVAEVAIRLDATGVLVKPAVGAGPQDAFAVFAETRRLADAVRNIQTTRPVAAP